MHNIWYRSLIYKPSIQNSRSQFYQIEQENQPFLLQNGDKKLLHSKLNCATPTSNYLLDRRKNNKKKKRREKRTEKKKKKQKKKVVIIQCLLKEAQVQSSYIHPFSSCLPPVNIRNYLIGFLMRGFKPLA